MLSEIALISNIYNKIKDMEVVNLVGDRLFLDYLITQYFNYTYSNNHVVVNYDSYLSIADVQNKIDALQSQYDEHKIAPDSDEKLLNNLQQAISILTDLKNRLD
jgi:hypothetical protein